MQVDVDLQDAYSSSTAQVPIAAETWLTWFNRWFELLHPSLPPACSYELCLRLTDDGEIASLNSFYRQQPQPTDVLAFAALEVEVPRSPPDQTELLHLGDIVISVDTAQRQSLAGQHSLTVELAWLAAHGFLHLLGWDHPDPASLEQMLKQQSILLAAVGLENPALESFI
uniref:Endoribonuclease YbeY n=1 Tax=Cyanothece sp. (strain PCC 7425 / ATCC 29141) TaxID=395961 RepID=YBEY_CYAP4|nr:RecName: Full=Endoribonuclease YbeY [Cyanothece sp. PCC 7425]